MAMSGMLVPAMWLCLLPSKLMAKDPILIKVQRLWISIAIPGTFIVDAIFVAFGILPFFDEALLPVSIKGPLIGIIFLCLPVSIIVTVVAVKTFALAAKNPPKSFIGIALALFSRKRFKELPGGMKRVVLKLRVSVFLVNTIAGGAVIGAFLIITPTWFQDNSHISESAILVICAVLWCCFCVFVFKPTSPKVKTSKLQAPRENQVGLAEKNLIRSLSMSQQKMTNLSDIAMDIPNDRWNSCSSFMALSVAVLLVSFFGIWAVVLLPFILIASLVRRCWVCCSTYKRDPKRLNIAVVGGGWAGCQVCMLKVKSVVNDTVNRIV